MQRNEFYNVWSEMFICYCTICSKLKQKEKTQEKNNIRGRAHTHTECSFDRSRTNSVTYEMLEWDKAWFWLRSRMGTDDVGDCCDGRADATTALRQCEWEHFFIIRIHFSYILRFSFIGSRIKRKLVAIKRSNCMGRLRETELIFYA